MESRKNNEGNKNHVATRFLLLTQIPTFSKNTRKTLDAVAVSFLPVTSFHSPRIQTAHCGFIASVFLVFDNLIFLCTPSPSTLVLMQGLCILVLNLLLYFCSPRRKVKCPAVEMLDVQLKSINIYISELCQEIFSIAHDRLCYCTSFNLTSLRDLCSVHTQWVIGKDSFNGLFCNGISFPQCICVTQLGTSVHKILSSASFSSLTYHSVICYSFLLSRQPLWN